jgi:hypothetical protein
MTIDCESTLARDRAEVNMLGYACTSGSELTDANGLPGLLAGHHQHLQNLRDTRRTILASHHSICCTSLLSGQFRHQLQNADTCFLCETCTQRRRSCHNLAPLVGCGIPCCTYAKTAEASAHAELLLPGDRHDHHATCDAVQKARTQTCTCSLRSNATTCATVRFVVTGF